jgi:hypothetical protein
MIARPVRGSVSTTGTSPCRRPRLVRVSRQDAISGRFGGTFPRLAEAAWLPIPQAGRDNSSRPASRPACRRIPLPSGELRAGPRPAPGTDSAGSTATAGNGYRLLPAICRGTIGISGHDRPSLTEGRLPLRPRERGAYLTGARSGMRRTGTVAVQEIDDLVYCQVARGAGSAARIPGTGQFTDLVSMSWPGTNSCPS